MTESCPDLNLRESSEGCQATWRDSPPSGLRVFPGEFACAPDRRRTFLEMIDLLGSERKFGRSIGVVRPLLSENNMKYLRKKATYLAFPFPATPATWSTRLCQQ